MARLFHLVGLALLPLTLFGCVRSEGAARPWVKPATETISCADYYSHIDGDRVFNNNVWNKAAAGSFAWTQCLERQPGSGVTGWSWTWPGKSRAIFGYPEVKRGVSPWAPLPHVSSSLPVAHEHVRSMRVTHELAIETNGDHNVATSLWLTNTTEIGEQPNPKAIVAELMIWTYATPGHMTPAGARQDDVELDGQRWEVWVDRNWHDASGANSNRWIYLTFRAKQSALKADFDVAALTRYAVAQNILPARFVYADIELGTEIMSGSGLAWVKSFDVQVTP